MQKFQRVPMLFLTSVAETTVMFEKKISINLIDLVPVNYESTKSRQQSDSGVKGRCDSEFGGWNVLLTGTLTVFGEIIKFHFSHRKI